MQYYVYLVKVKRIHLPRHDEILMLGVVQGLTPYRYHQLKGQAKGR